MRDGAFAGFCCCHPLLIEDTTNAAVIKHKLVPAFRETCFCAHTCHCAGQNGVVPVHRPAIFGLERSEIGVDHAINCIGSCCPLWLWIIEEISESRTAMKSMANGRTTSEQRIIPWFFVNFTRPSDGAIMALHVHYPVECIANCGPQSSNSFRVSGAQPVCPYTCGNVCRHIRVEFAIFNCSIRHVVVEPPTSGVLVVGEPRVGGKSCVMTTHNVKRNGSLDVIPRITVSVGIPRNHSVGQL